MKHSLPFLVLSLLSFVQPLYADDCSEEISSTYEEFKSSKTLDREIQDKALKIIEQASKLCISGQVTEGLELLKQAKYFLGIN